MNFENQIPTWYEIHSLLSREFIIQNSLLYIFFIVYINHIFNVNEITYSFILYTPITKIINKYKNKNKLLINYEKSLRKLEYYTKKCVQGEEATIHRR